MGLHAYDYSKSIQRSLSFHQLPGAEHLTFCNLFQNCSVVDSILVCITETNI
jgi:hypothetical protein